MTIYQRIGELDPGTVIKLFKDAYSYHHGEKKALNILNVVETNARITRYINEAIRAKQMPAAKSIELLMNNVSYFMLSKAETLCLGGLFTYKLWHENAAQVFDLDNMDIDHLLYELANLIVNCSQQKFTSSGNVFDAFFTEVNRRTHDK
jgi:hypothetical protein